MVDLLVLQCTCQHSHEPPAETFFPELLIFRLYRIRQPADIICLPIPGFQFFYVVCERVEILGIGGVNDRLQIIPETLDACQLQGQEYGVVASCPHRSEPAFPSLFFLIEV